MSKSKKRLVPVRRFKEFENADAWEQRKLSEIATMNARIGWQNLRTSEFLDSGDYMLITGTDFKDGKINYSTIHYVDKERYDQDKKIQIKNDSILITKDGTLGKVAYVKGLTKPATLNAGVFNVRVRANNLVDSQYLFHYLKAPFLLKYASEQSTGGTIKHLNQNVLVNFPVPLPSKQEQQKIGNFFQQIDTLITLHQRKLDKLKRVKSAYLTEMFPAEGEREPKRRFPGFTGAWEQRKFFDNIEKVIDFRGRTPKKLGMEWSAEGYTALSALNVKDGYIDFTADVHYANQDLYDNWMVGNDLYKGQVLFTTEAPMGNVAQVPDNRKYVLSQRTIAFNVDKTKVTNDFLAVLLRSQNVQHTLKSLASGGTAQGVSQKSLSQLKVIVPIKPKEQQKIGDFFKQLDSLIALHQRKLDKLKKMKAAYLNEMFV